MLAKLIVLKKLPRMIKTISLINCILLLLLSCKGYAQTTNPPGNIVLTRDEAVRLALAQASNYQQSQFNERSAAEDVLQAQAAFRPKFVATPTLIYNSPAIGGDVPHTPSFIGANAVTEIQGLVGVTGELDVAKRLRATLNRNRALLEAAHAGTDVARRALIEATEEAYYALAVTTARRRSAEQSLAAAEEFERITGLLVTGGEVAQVDLLRARLQTSARRDELEQARSNEAATTDSLRVLLGYGMTVPVAVADLLTNLPDASELQKFTEEAIARRPEYLQFDSLLRAAKFDVNIARAEGRPQFTYSISGGFATDSLKWKPLHQHTGVLATVGLTIPLFDWGASRSREKQAEFRAQTIQSTRTLALRGFAQQFSTARSQAISATTRIRLTGAAIADAERNVEISIARYRAGEAQIIEVTDAQNTLTAQRTALVQAIYDYQVALARLRQATGQ